MTRNARIAAGAAALATLALVVGGYFAARDTGPARPVGNAAPPAQDDAAPDAISFSGRDVITGDTVSLADFRGKPVVINIWASWCPGCNAEAKALAAFAEAHPEAAFVGVDFQDSESAARGFYEEHGWTFPSVFDPDGSIAFSLGLQGTPTTIFLDAEHREAARIVGETDEQGFAEGLAAATRS